MLHKPDVRGGDISAGPPKHSGREIQGRQAPTMLGQVSGIEARAATDFQHVLIAQAGEFETTERLSRQVARRILNGFIRPGPAIIS